MDGRKEEEGACLWGGWREWAVVGVKQRGAWVRRVPEHPMGGDEMWGNRGGGGG